MVHFSCSAWNVFVLFGVFSIWNVNLAGAQTACLIKTPASKTFSEQDAPGIVLLRLPGGAGATWKVVLKSPVLPANVSLAPYFRLEQTDGNATYYLNKTFDLEEVNGHLKGLTTLEFSAICSLANQPDTEYQWFAIVTAVNEFPPQFVRLPEGGFNISEDKRVGDTILTLKDYVEDKDVALNHPGYDFTLLAYADAVMDGRQKLNLGSSLTGSLVVKEAFDYDTLKPDTRYYMLNVSVGDRNGQTSTGTIRINIMDADDQAPEFFHANCSTPCFTYYVARIRDSFTGAITWLSPAPIAARDLDSLDATVTYRLKQGDPKNFAQFVTVNRSTGVPSIIKPVAESQAAAFYLIVEAVEETLLKHSQQTSLILYISGRNSTEPTLPAIIVERPAETEPAFRTATIVLGVLFGLLLLILVIFVVICSLSSHIRTIPVLPKTIGKLSSEDNPPEVGGSPNSTRRKSRKSVNLAKSSGESRLDFMRSLKRPRPASPTLKSYASTHEERDPDVQNLPVSREIDFDNNGVGAMEESFAEHPPVSTITDSDVTPYEDRMGLVYGAEGMGEESTGMSNPVYDAEKDGDNVDTSATPVQESPVYI